MPQVRNFAFCLIKGTVAEDFLPRVPFALRLKQFRFFPTPQRYVFEFLGDLFVKSWILNLSLKCPQFFVVVGLKGDYQSLVFFINQ